MVDRNQVVISGAESDFLSVVQLGGSFETFVLFCAGIQCRGIRCHRISGNKDSDIPCRFEHGDRFAVASPGDVEGKYKIDVSSAGMSGKCIFHQLFPENPAAEEEVEKAVKIIETILGK